MNKAFYGFLAISLLASACSSPGSNLNDYPTLPRFARTHPDSAASPTSSTRPSAEPGGGFGEFLGKLLGFGLCALTVKTALDSGLGDSSYESNMTGPEKKMGRYMTVSEHKRYYEEHPETWTPVYPVREK